MRCFGECRQLVGRACLGGWHCECTHPDVMVTIEMHVVALRTCHGGISHECSACVVFDCPCVRNDGELQQHDGKLTKASIYLKHCVQCRFW